MLDGFDFSFQNVSRLLTFLRYTRARRLSRPKAAAACFTRDATFWILGEEAQADLVRVEGQQNVAQVLRQLDAHAVVLKTILTKTRWKGDEVTIHWRELLRSPGTGAPYWRTGFSRLQFRRSLICSISSVFTDGAAFADHRKS